MKHLLPWFFFMFCLGIAVADATRFEREEWNEKMGRWGKMAALYLINLFQ